MADGLRQVVSFSGPRRHCLGTGLHLAIVGPMDVPRLAEELALRPEKGRAVPAGLGGHPVTELVLALSQLPCQLDLVTLDHGIPEPVCLANDAIRLSIGPERPRVRTRSKDLFAVERAFIARQLHIMQPEVVSAHWTYEYALGALDSARPTLITVHDWAPTILWHARDPYRTVRLLMQILTFTRGRNFAAVSPYMARRVELVTRRPVAVLPNGLTPSWFSTGTPRPVRNGRVLALNSGFDRRKNVKSLLAAWPSVLIRCPDAELVLTGPGYEVGGPAYEWALERGLHLSVSFLGAVPRAELQDLMRSVSIFAHPSLEESFGMVILEAMALGLPVLGGQHSGAVPWLLKGGAGVLVDVRRPEEIAGGLLRLFDEPGLADSTALRARERAREHFGIHDLAEAYLAKLTSLISGST
jgi:L-malate glycosyltransferase